MHLKTAIFIIANRYFVLMFCFLLFLAGSAFSGSYMTEMKKQISETKSVTLQSKKEITVQKQTTDQAKALAPFTTHKLLMVGSPSEAKNLSSYKYFRITDRKHYYQLSCGDGNDSSIYHGNFFDYHTQWRFESAGKTTWQGNSVDCYSIFDRKGNKALVAGFNYGSHVYHQDPGGRENAKWMLLPGGIIMD
ncbi:MAG: hypothetical protein HQM08_22875 [Candidatus Riflebacteria bacterium]|nr:hypothetical protein [Candidatus Riflebacteria bacterium]